MIITTVIVAINLYGFIQLRQDFDLTMYIPSDSYAHQYAKAREEYFPYHGIDAAVYCCKFNQPDITLLTAIIVFYMVNRFFIM